MLFSLYASALTLALIAGEPSTFFSAVVFFVVYTIVTVSVLSRLDTSYLLGEVVHRFQVHRMFFSHLFTHIIGSLLVRMTILLYFIP